MNMPDNYTIDKTTYHRQILGIRFFVGDAPKAVAIGSRGGLVVVPAAPALMELRRDPEYRLVY